MIQEIRRRLKLQGNLLLTKNKNTMILKWMNQVLLLLTIGLIIFFGIRQKKMSRVAFVRSAVVLEKYSGMDEAKGIYQKKIDQWNIHFDSLEFNYKKTAQELNQISAL